MNHNEFEQSQDANLLHEKYQAESTEMPAASLDKAILQAAHQVVDENANQAAQAENKASVKRLVKRTWYAPAAYAAVLVLSLSVVMKLGFDAQVEAPVPVDMEMMESDLDHASMTEERGFSLQKQMRAEQLRERREILSQQKQKMKSTRHMPVQQQLSRSSVVAKRSALPQVSRVSEQQKHIDELMQLFNDGKMDTLKPALIQYRKDYPVSILGDDLPEALRELEMKWNLGVKVLE